MVIEMLFCRLEQAQTAQRMVADDKQDLERQLQDIGQAKVDLFDVPYTITDKWHLLACHKHWSLSTGYISDKFCIKWLHSVQSCKQCHIKQLMVGSCGIRITYCLSVSYGQHDELFSNSSFIQIRWSASLKPLFYALSTFPSLKKLLYTSLSYV